jgi:hypothetical protein
VDDRVEYSTEHWQAVLDTIYCRIGLEHMLDIIGDVVIDNEENDEIAIHIAKQIQLLRQQLHSSDKEVQ